LVFPDKKIEFKYDFEVFEKLLNRKDVATFTTDNGIKYILFKRKWDDEDVTGYLRDIGEIK
jgi:hypothetical protein